MNIDLKNFFLKINHAKKIHKNNFNKKIIKQIKHLNEIDKIHLIEKKKINQYYFISRMNTLSYGDESYVIDGGGTTVYIAYQALEIKGIKKLFIQQAYVLWALDFLRLSAQPLIIKELYA